MKIELEIDTETEEERILKFIKAFCRENFRNCKISIDGKLKDEFDWDR